MQIKKFLDVSKEFFWPFLTFGFFAGVSLSVLFDADGWPMNHEHNTFVIRSLIYAKHYSFYDFFPIYSSLDNNNFGSPFLAFYHKLFYVFSAPLFLLISDIKIALAFSILLFLVIGSFGIFITLRELKLSKVSALCGGIFLIAANYTITNWLVRGAMAELSAMMIAPWVFYYFLRMIREKKISYGLAISLALVFFAHSVIFFYIALMLAATLLLLLFADRKFFDIFLDKSSLLPVALFLALCLPNFFVIYEFWQEYDMGSIVSPELNPANNFHSFSDYFLGYRKWQYGQQFQGITCQIDAPLIIAIIIGFIPILLAPKEKIKLLKPIIPLIIILLFCAILQMPIAIVFYNHFFAAEFIQFPWRLLAFITPIIIILALFLLEKFLDERWGRVAILSCLIAMTLSCGSFSKLNYHYFPTYNSLSDYNNISFNSVAEYVPKRFINKPFPSFKGIAENNFLLGCKTVSNQVSDEVKNVRFDFDCKNSAQITLPIFISKFHKISSNHQKIFCEESRYMAGLCDVKLPQGQGELQIDMPNFFSLFFNPDPSLEIQDTLPKA